MLKRSLLLALCLSSAMSRGCKGNTDHEAAPPVQGVVLDRFESIADGASEAYKVPPGIYRLQMTSTADGASVTWVGASCNGSKKTTVFDANCSLQQDGQLEIGNPSHLGLGASISVTLKLTRL